MNKYCVISAVGKQSLYREWMQGNPDFDLHLIVCDESFPKYHADTPYIWPQKGFKFRLVADYLHRFPDYLTNYDYFFLPDDDIRMDSATISKLFRAMEA